MTDKEEKLLPPLSDEEFNSLKADIEVNGQLQPVFVDENGDILDGEHRFKILGKKAKTKTIRGLSDGEKEMFTYRCNFHRRNLSPSQKAVARKHMKATAKALRKQDPKKWTQAKLAAGFGVARETVRDWFTNNGETANSSKPATKPDGRVSLSKDQQAIVVQQLEAGESQQQVAANHGVSQQTVSNIKKKSDKAKKKEADRKRNAAAIKKAIGDNDAGVKIGDFRKVAKTIPDASVDMIFTDPPWDRKALDEMYGDLGQVALDKLIEGGSMLVYAGHAMVDDAIKLIEREGLNFYWLCAEFRPEGPHNRRSRSGFIVTFIPILWFVKGAERYDTSVFVKDSVSTPKPDKKAHAWQQSVECANYYIEKLSHKNGLVFDPFCGGGTTAVAAKHLGRKWLTCDTDKESATIARGRILDAQCK